MPIWITCTTLISFEGVKTIEVDGKIQVKNICTLPNKPLRLEHGWDVNVWAWVCIKKSSFPVSKLK